MQCRDIRKSHHLPDERDYRRPDQKIIVLVLHPCHINLYTVTGATNFCKADRHLTSHLAGCVAHWLEHRTHDQKVVGLNPISAITTKTQELKGHTEITG